MTQDTRPPKVLIAARQGHITEVEMIKGLRQSGIDIHAAFESTSPQLQALQDAGVPVRTLDLRSNADFRNARRIRRWIKEEGFEIVHGLANRPVANLIWASYGLRNKVVAYRGTAGHVSRWDPTCYIKWLNPRINRIVCVSKAVERNLAANGVSPDKLITIYKGQDLRWYADLDPAKARAAVDQEFGIPSGTLLIGMAANMRAVKGADLLLRALMELPDHVHGFFIGEVRDPIIDELARDRRISHRVHFTGFRPDAPQLAGALDINVAPSRSREGLSKSVIEAMAQRIPTVVSDVGGLPELLGEEGAQYVFPAGDSALFLERLKSLVEAPHERQQAGKRARHRVETVFNLQATVEKTRKTYYDLVR